jgi:hypothetical protein
MVSITTINIKFATSIRPYPCMLQLLAGFHDSSPLDATPTEWQQFQLTNNSYV